MCNDFYDITEIGQRISKRLDELGWTLGQLAIKSECAKSTISRYLSGSTPNPSFQEIARISKVLNVSIDWLCFGDHEEEDERKINDQMNFDLDELYTFAKTQLNIDEKRFLLQALQLVVDTSIRNDQVRISSQKFNKYSYRS